MRISDWSSDVCSSVLAKHRCRPGARPRDPLESARGSALPDLHPFPPPIDRPGQWVPAPSAGTTAIVVARKRLADTTCARTAASLRQQLAGDDDAHDLVGAFQDLVHPDRKSTRMNSSH